MLLFPFCRTKLYTVGDALSTSPEAKNEPKSEKVDIDRELVLSYTGYVHGWGELNAVILGSAALGLAPLESVPRSLAESCNHRRACPGAR